MTRVYTTTNTVKRFPQPGGWVYLPIEQSYEDLGFGAHKPKWGLVPAIITIGNTTWAKSLLPLGDGTLFIALNEKVRKAEKIQVGDKVTVREKVSGTFFRPSSSPRGYM